MAKKRVRHHVNPLADMTEHHFNGFDNDHPIIIDIGADRGEFTMQLLEKFGETRNFIVCEIRKPLAEKLCQKFEKNQNVIVFDGDVTRNFENIVRPSVNRGIKIEEIFINFPDPWLKDRHKKRRVITERFLCNVNEWMPTHTRWVFQTDQKKLFDETIEILQKINGMYMNTFDVPPYDITTKWEDAKTEQGEKIHRLAFYRKAMV